MMEGPAPVRDMTPEELRRSGHSAVDWVADYLGRVGGLPVLSQVAPGDIRAAIPADPPIRGEPMDRILADLDEVILPGITHWQHPRFLAYFAITGSGPGILGELLSAGLNVNGMLWRTSPAVTELEQVTLGWLRDMLGLPKHLRGIIMDTASMSTLVALATARHRSWPEVREEGLTVLGAGRRPRLYASEEAHSSVDKAAIALGLGHRAVRKIATDDRYRMRPEALADAIAEDRDDGWEPFAVVATVGTTVTTSIDPVPDIAGICAEHDLWLHVDGAYGGVAAIAPEHRGVLAGTERADSVVVNPHKWLATPIDCSAFYVRDPDELKAAFSLVPDYLTTSEEVDNLMDWGVQLGRRFRALKLWFVLRWFGHAGLSAMIREHIRLAGVFADWVDAHPSFERVAPTPLSTVCFRIPHPDTDEQDRRNEALLDAVNRSGTAYLSAASVGGRLTLRVAIGNLRTTETDLRTVMDLLDEEAARLGT
jgi:aromatic-L-amino-acid/L-tryptophan decarboxylase